MSVTRIATRYAKSLIDLAQELGKLPKVSDDINLLAEAAKNRDLHLMLKSPIISPDKKNAVLNTLFGQKMDVLTMRYLTLLVNKGREGYLGEIAAEFVNQYKNIQKITSVKVISAAPLHEGVIDTLKAHLLSSGITHPNLAIETEIDPDLVGGFVLEFDNKRYDASISNKLMELKSGFSKNLYIKEF